jgi:hypothetical protein
MNERFKLSNYNRCLLDDLCINNDCTMDELIHALECNVVSEQLRIQIVFNRTGELPR